MTLSAKRWTVFAITFVVVFAALWLLQRNTMSTINNSLGAADLVNGRLEQPVTKDGTQYLVPPSYIFDSGLSTGDIPSIDAPTFTSIAAMDQLLGDDLYGIDVEASGEHRFYPVQILNWHQVVNDEIGGKKIAVTYDPLTGSSAVWDRGESTFHVSGKVFNDNTILTDDAGSWWLQMTGLSISGPSMGKMLNLLPSKTMTWANWKDAYPQGKVLSNETGFVRDYTRHPYGSYDTAKTIYFPPTSTDKALAAKWIVFGVNLGDAQIAFSEKILQGKGVLNDTLSDEPIVAVYDFNTDVTHVFHRTYGDDHKTLTLEYDFDEKAYTDAETGSTWNAGGLATKGELKGTQLLGIPSVRAYWFAWSATFDDTKLSGVEAAQEGTTP